MQNAASPRRAQAHRQAANRLTWRASQYRARSATAGMRQDAMDRWAQHLDAMADALRSARPMRRTVEFTR